MTTPRSTLEEVRRAWEQLVNVTEPGTGPWQFHHDQFLGWCVRRSAIGGSRPIVVHTKREAIAVAAALNAVARLEAKE